MSKPPQPAKPFVSYAQNFEDVVLFRGLGRVHTGTYIDVGAADPLRDSVTNVFYERGWSGINIEPVAQHVARLEAERPRDTTVSACAGAKAGWVDLHVVPDTGLSTTKAEVLDPSLAAEISRTRVVSLDDVLDEFHPDGEIHFLKVDVEGAEREVLEGIDLKMRRPWVVLVEATKPNSSVQNHEEWEDLLTGRGYRMTLFDGLNRFYVAEEHAGLGDVLSYPACALDGAFVTLPHHEVLESYDRLQASSQQLELRAAEIEESYARQEQLLGRSRSDEHTELEVAYGRLTETYDETLDAFTRLEQEHGRAIDGYERLDTEYRSALESYARLDKAYGEAVRVRSELDSVIAGLRSGVAEMGESLQDALTRCEQSRNENSLANARIHELTVCQQEERESSERELNELRSRANELETLQDSTAWRVTAPVRRVSDLLRRLAR